ncbi:carbamoyltransferase [Kitasatospora sp. GP30]|uniref:carbamoyltransferase C-terminal domain-containing protein n=1 Tax=Kitasatospora sp. GP30 TaxID=3035084 RepID=UPI000CB56DE3|nr:carbamoyltransferase C-terminal domain-containing protein [Kitasatospora sp. GP30]MDH6139956.1 carbamoyltransferase [Kitasatospora sp. GP30]
MIVLGLVGRPDVRLCHDAAACLVIDGKVVGALEQERISRRRHAKGEGPEGAVRALLDAFGVHPSEIQAIGYAWADAPEGALAPETGIPCGVRVTDRLTETILPTLAGELGTRDIAFFDHHLCHAAQAYYLNPHPTADVLVADGWGGDGSTSLFHVADGCFRLLERYDRTWSLGMFYGAASAYARLGTWGAGKLMGLSSYGRTSDLRYFSFDPADASFRLDRRLRGSLTGGRNWDRLGRQWLDTFEASSFPYTPDSANVFDYAPFAADVQATVEQLGLDITARLRRLSGEDTLLLSGGVALNAPMNRRIALESGYARVCGTVAPNDGGTVFGAAMLAEALFGKAPEVLPADGPPPIFLGPPVDTASIESALAARGVTARALDPERLRAETVRALAQGQVVAWFDGRNEFGPRALGARSLLASPRHRTTLDKLNRVKGREAWRPAALSLTADGFRRLGMEAPVAGLSDYMLCMHKVDEERSTEAVAGVHVDRTTRGQYVAAADDGFGALLTAVGEDSGLAGVINTSLNTKGDPMVLGPEQAIDLMAECPDVDLLVLGPYLVRRS